MQKNLAAAKNQGRGHRLIFSRLLHSLQVLPAQRRPPERSTHPKAMAAGQEDTGCGEAAWGGFSLGTLSSACSLTCPLRNSPSARKMNGKKMARMPAGTGGRCRGQGLERCVELQGHAPASATRIAHFSTVPCSPICASGSWKGLLPSRSSLLAQYLHKETGGGGGPGGDASRGQHAEA